MGVGVGWGGGGGGGGVPYCMGSSFFVQSERAGVCKVKVGLVKRTCVHNYPSNLSLVGVVSHLHELRN